jgi:hypothetical protein
LVEWFDQFKERSKMEPITKVTPEMKATAREKALAELSPRYNHWVHLAIPSLTACAVVAVCLAFVRHLNLLDLIAVPITFVLLNAGEWRIHRDLLHRRIKPFQLLYDRHTPVHHVIYTTDDMSLKSRREFYLVLMPPFAIIGAFLAAAPAPAALWLLGFHNVALLTAATMMFYMVSYEWLHLSYHLPPDSFVGRMKIIRLLRRHHAMHHNPELMQRWNFNVSLPLWDWVRRTVYTPERAAARAARRRQRTAAA